MASTVIGVSATPRGAVFLDRDGVINRKPADGEYVRSRDEFEFLPGSIDAIARLHRLGYTLVVVTNQRGIALGRMTAEAVADIHRAMLARLDRAGAVVHGVFVCPHERDTCDCRKPATGLFLQARAADPSIAFDRAAVVGDSLGDIEAANRIGARAYLVGPDAVARARRARDAGLRVDGQARSLAALVDAGVFDPVSAEASTGATIR